MSLSASAISPEVLPSSQHQVSGSLLSRLYWVAAIMLLLTHALMIWQSRSPAVNPIANDDAQYLLLARSLRSFHYTDQHVLGAPVHAQYPPVYPALIAVATAVAGEHVDAAVVMTILCSVVALLLIYDMARRLASPLVGLLVLAPLAFNAHLVGYAGRIASEPAYMALSFAVLWVLLVFPQSRRALFWAGVLAILAALTRSVGLSLVAALLLLWVLQIRLKAAAIFAVTAAATVGGWLYWTAVSPDQFTARSYAAVATTTAKHLPGVLGILEVRSIKFVKTYVAGSLTAGLEVPTIAGTSIDNGLWTLVLLVMAAIGLWSLRKRLPIFPLYVLAFLGLLLLYPFKMTRFFMPVAPLVLLAAFLGVVELGRRWKPSVAVAVAMLLSGIILIGPLPRSLGLVKSLENCDRSDPTNSPGCFPAESRAFFAATRLAGSVLPPNAVVLTIKEAPFSYYSGLTVYHPELAFQKAEGDLPGFLDRRGIHYVLISAFVGGSAIAKDLIPTCQRMEILGRFEPRTALFQIHPPGDPTRSATDACTILGEWARDPDKGDKDEELDAAVMLPPAPRL